MTPLYRKLIVLGIVMALVVLTGSVLLAQPDWCVSADGSPVGCAEVTLTPSEATGDFYVDGVLVAPARNVGQLMLAPDVEHIIEIKNIQSTEAGFGTLFNYADVSTTLRVRAGESRTKSIRLVKNYIRGTLNFTCDVKGAVETDVVACRVTIDEVVQPDVPAGQVAPYILDPGDRVVLVEVIGDQASLFDPANKQQTVKVYTGRTTTLRTTFAKKGHLFLALDKPDVVADFYVDGTQVATQVAIFDMWVAPSKNHTAEAKNFSDPAAAGVYTWRDAKLYTYLGTGADKTLTFKLQKRYLKGFLELACDIKNYAGEDARCTVAIDEVPLGDIAAGEKATYTLDPGQHNWQVALAGENAGLWAPADLTKSVTITASATPRKVKATFQKAGHLVANFNQPTVVADFYVNGELVAQQVPSIERWVGAGSYKVEVQNFRDTALPGYHWLLAQNTKSVYLSSGSEKTVTFDLKVDLKAVEQGVNELCITGVGAVETPMYFGGPGPHPIRAYKEGGGVHAWAGSIEAMAKGPFEVTQLVVCIAPEVSFEVERCNYTDGKQAIRYRYAMNARLMASHNGQVIGSTTLYGTEPSYCPWTKTWGQTLTLYGKKVTTQQMLDWLRPWVAP
ncbi:MAG: hypothetical protein JXB30_01585 [Anaerolineae bacterium]|nr:hypothetical protein [Anaerolineae bacterium]